MADDQNKVQVCETDITLGEHLSIGSHQNGKISVEFGTQDSDVAFFDTSKQSVEGPFLVYFSMQFDQRQEGIMGLVLSKYDSDAMLFMEQEIFRVQDGLAQISTLVDEGVYTVSLLPIASTLRKFDFMGITESEMTNSNLFDSPCMTADYSYYIVPISEIDADDRPKAYENLA